MIFDGSDMSYQACIAAGVPAAVLEAEFEEMGEDVGWSLQATDKAVVAYRHLKNETTGKFVRYCVLCLQPGHLAADCKNGCHHCKALPDKLTGWAVHKSFCPRSPSGRKFGGTADRGGSGLGRTGARGFNMPPPPKTLGRAKNLTAVRAPQNPRVRDGRKVAFKGKANKAAEEQSLQEEAEAMAVTDGEEELPAQEGLTDEGKDALIRNLQDQLKGCRASSPL